MVPLRNTFLLYLINCIKSQLLEKRVLIIVHKSVQTSRTKILRNSKRYAVLTWDPVNRLTTSSLLGLGNRLPAKQLRASAVRLRGKKKSYSYPVSNSKWQTRGICSSLLYQGCLLCNHVHKLLLNFMP